MDKKSWSKKINRARQVEKEILKWYRRNYDPDAKLSVGYNSDCDIISSKNCVEIKEDRMAHQTGNYAFEYETHDGKPSGYAGTKATIFCLVDWEYVTFIDTWLLKQIINSLEYKTSVKMGEVFTDGQNKGWLIPRDKILNNPMATVISRWFPVFPG